MTEKKRITDERLLDDVLDTYAAAAVESLSTAERRISGVNNTVVLSETPSSGAATLTRLRRS